ncbi:hypothetical protein K4B79_27130 [Streptomyces lincolnensis]|uniref:hypothetical protein n=1 Tax=Streptomyces lincolnensis TaxID=1915 RepID=UPI001E53EDD3|nr:hypothetical protein [Streptomyces lincolnensis]MCD7441886.1 hypothetical protein [Streptomyces lincolnensis]
MKLIIVDAKSSASGLIREQQVDFDTLREHKKKHEADQVAIVGPSFTENRIKKRAAEHGVALISAEFLADVLRRQSDTPLAPHDLVGLFDTRRDGVEAGPSGDRKGSDSAVVSIDSGGLPEGEELFLFGVCERNSTASRISGTSTPTGQHDAGIGAASNPDE